MIGDMINYTVIRPLGIIRFYLTLSKLSYSHFLILWQFIYVMCFVHLGSLLFLCLKETCSPCTFSYMECKNYEAQYLKTAQNADRTL